MWHRKRETAVDIMAVTWYRSSYRAIGTEVKEWKHKNNALRKWKLKSNA